MSPVDVMKISATQLRDLPGNQIVTSLSTSISNPVQKYKKNLKLSLQSSPSEHFQKASNGSNEPEEGWVVKSNDHVEIHKVFQSREFPYSNEFGESPRINRVNCTNKIETEATTNERENSNLDSKLNVSYESSLTSSPGSKRESDKSILEKNNLIPIHQFSVKDEQRLLDDLLQFDEDEDDRIYAVQTDEDIYQLWRIGEGRQMSKNTNQMNSAGRGKTTMKSFSDGTKSTGVGGSSKRSSVSEVIRGWETIASSQIKKPLQRSREDKKTRPSLPFSNSGTYNSKYAPNNETQESSFMFFHYTDIARYIQQYRTNHQCGYPSHPSCCQHPSSLTFQDVRDLNFPYKFDLSTNSITRRETSGKTSNQNSRNGSLELSDVQTASRHQVTRSPHPDYSSPTPYRSPAPHRAQFSISPMNEYKPMKTETSNKANLQSMWNSYERPPPGRHKEALVKALNAIECRNPYSTQVRSPDHSSTRKVVVGNNNQTTGDGSSMKTLNDVKSRAETSTSKDRTVEGGRSDKSNGAVKQSIAVPQMNRLTLDNVVHQKSNGSSFENDSTKDTPSQEEEEEEAGVEEEVSSDDNWQYEIMSGSYLTSDMTSRHASRNKNIRMRSLIAAEVKDLQKRRVISIEQKQKLDRFKQALSQSSAISNTMTPSSDNTMKTVLAGSVRAYYTKTAHQVRHLSNCDHVIENRSLWREEEKTNPEDHPVIVVSQPHLRHQQKRRIKPDSPLMRKKLIGGKVSDTHQEHPADTKQFTRITDLLRIKKRQQDGRHSISGISRVTSDASTKPERHHSPNHYGNSARGRRLKVTL